MIGKKNSAVLTRINRILEKDGARGLLDRVRYRFSAEGRGGYQNMVYKQWQAETENRDLSEIKKEISAFELKPRISIVVPVHDVDAEYLDSCLESVMGQVYDNWELCLFDDASGKVETRDCLASWGGRGDPRIKLSRGEVNRHISISSNEAIKMAGGEFIALLDHDDELSPYALYEVARLINEHPDADLIYSDEDKIDEKGNRSSPFFKPDWSPELLLSVNYINHLCVIRRAAGDRAGWFRTGFEGAQDHDLFLRISAASDRIFHIPRVLYHWRALSGSTAADVSEKSYAGDAGIKALKDYLAAAGEKASVEAGAIPTEYFVRYLVKGNPMVSIIIPFRDSVGLLRNCLDSILTLSSYVNYEVMLVSNNSQEDETRDYLDSLDDPRVRVLRHDIPFNYSKINNWAAQQAAGEFLLFLNNDTEVITNSWIEDMLGYATRDEIGAVGAKLLFKDGTIQHGGVIVGIGGFADHIFAGGHEGAGTLFGRDTWSRNYLAVTAACMMIEKAKFDEVGGFDEEFVVCGSDVELCLRLFKAGYRNVYLAFTKLYHYEAQTRRNRVDQKDIECSLEHYAPYLLAGDPYYNENLSLAETDGNSFREVKASA